MVWRILSLELWHRRFIRNQKITSQRAASAPIVQASA
jgi:hypothetical protein